MIRARSFGALLRRNFIYRKRNIIGSIAEIISPILFILVMVAVKVSLQDNPSFSPEVVPPSFPPNEDAIITYSFNDYVTAIQAKRQCFAQINPYNSNPWAITGLENQGYNWQVPFVKCDSRACQAAGENAAELYCQYQILAVAPSNSSDTIGIARSLSFTEYTYNKYPALVTNKPFNYSFIKIFESNQDIENYVTSSNYGSSGYPKIGLAVIFTGGSSEKDYAYTLRVNSTNFNSPENEGRPAATTTPSTSKIFDNLANIDDVCVPIGGTALMGPGENSCTYQYIYNGLLIIQRLVDDWIIDHSGAATKGYSVAEHGVQFVPFPSKQYTKNGFYASISDFLPLLVVLGFLYPVACVIRSITLEKQLKQKELMKMMSVSESDIGWSWFCSYFLFYLITSFALTGSTMALYSNSSGGFLWVFWAFAMLGVIVFCMFIASLFTKATTATLVGLLATIVGYFVTLAADYANGNASLINLVSIFPMAAISYGLQEIGRLEDAGIGVNSSTFSSSDNTSGFTFLAAIRSLAFDSIFWGILTWYCNRTIRTDYGQPLPFYFPFTMSYWFPGRAAAPESSDESEITYHEGFPVEPVTEALRAQTQQGEGIEIRGLRKVFGDKLAVDNLSLNMYKHQVTALLGHNGAGKTTTISMLTGMITPTEGYAVIAGKDIRTQMSQIRDDIGICLQHDCLFPDLTVQEHLEFFNRLKGSYSKYSRQEIAEKIQTSMDDVALLEKRNTYTKNLSGGMKRKLSVAIAFCGDSKTVLLDEPTSGMDPFSRRFTWNVIRHYRQDRCIILTTHFMDEADILGDRIAIMASGQLRCAGSSLFLKKHYGVGYQLTIEKNPKSIGSSNHASNDDNVDDTLREIVHSVVKEAKLLSNVGTEMSFQLPLGAASSFTTMFEALDAEVGNESIVTYGVSITTLDEVFLLVARGDSGEKTELKSSKHVMTLEGEVTDNEDKSFRSRMDLENEGLFLRHFQALFQKRALNFKRDKKAWVCSTIIPTVTVMFGLLMFTFISPNRNLTALELNLDAFNKEATTEIRNPIPFNDAGSADFACQPGFCLSNDFFSISLTGESYAFCGAPFFGEAFANSTCSEEYCGPLCPIADSNDIMSRLDESEATGMGVQGLTYIIDTSKSVYSTSSSFLASQYGSLHFSHDTNSTDYYNEVIANCKSAAASLNYFNASFCEYLQGIGYVVNYNFTSIHASPLYQALADQAILREALDDNAYTITATIHPLPITARENSFGKAEDAFFAWFLLVFSFPFIAGTFGSFIVNERQSKAKHLQTVAGVKGSAYWLSSYAWDIMNYQIPMWTTVILMFAFGVSTFTTTTRGVVGGVILTLVLFGPASAGFTYCVSFGFSSPSMCNLFVIIFNFLIGLAGPLVAFILLLIGKDSSNPNQSLVTASRVIEWILRFIPAFNLGSGLFKCIQIDSYEFLANHPITVWHKSVILWEIIFQAFLCFFYIALAMQIDKWSSNPRALNKWRSFTRFLTCRFCCGGGRLQIEEIHDGIADDTDVVNEQERVLAGESNSDLIVLNQLTKQYDTGKLAVNNVSLGIPPGQCFGLLGINGAGKTTIMGMLTAEFPPTKGDATLAGFSVTNEPEKTRRRIGYCPQFDALFTNMTGREHVTLYAAIKGVPRAMVADAVKLKLTEVGLNEFDSDRLSSGYSGGMRRKLSLACATIGQPQIVFLDEVSTGMDPVARRDMWEVISEMVTGGNVPPEERTSVILTTHSMAECEALCPRIGIMAAGRLRCLGSAQHLKTRFGQGFQVEMKLEDVSVEHDDFKSVILRIAQSTCVVSTDTEAAPTYENIVLDLQKVYTALETLTGDSSLSCKISLEDPTGYVVYRNAVSPAGASLHEVALFATAELRMTKLVKFFESRFTSASLRERQDNKVRYEVGSDGTRISNIFAKIEENKVELRCADYGVSQTSLEQVFNMHAAEAEKLKYGGDDH